ncbi:MAG: sodium:proton antiporter [Bacteroidota bacterium]|nr:sodium:proton antiporter [Bacteroidota bacterium]
MDFFVLFSVLISLAAVFSYINIKWLHLPSGIALMLMGAVISFGLIITSRFSPGFVTYIQAQLSTIDFSEFILGILLSFLLFAGSLHVSYQQLKKSAVSIITFSTIGVLISTLLVGSGTYFLFRLFGENISFIYCLLFGSLISPTDPIAVLGILKKAGISKSVEIKITGESLFNDGVGVVIFATILQIIVQGSENASVGSVLTLFAREAIGGILVGFIIGYAGYKLMKSIDHFQTEILLSLAMVMGGYSLCHYLHVSGPLAMVVAGIFTGYKGLREAMSDTTRDYLEKFWEVTDEILNSVLFMLIGLQLVILTFQWYYFVIGLIIAISMIFFRYISLWIPSILFRFKNTLEPKTLSIMAWGGLRGGISIALALSMPAGDYKDAFVMITYTVVLFSIIVQGMTMGKIVRKFKI